jgi:hypothetical protein
MTADAPRPVPESVPVQLTRMEGKLDLVQQRMNDLVPRVDRHEGEIANLQLETQRLALEAKARDETAIALATALRDAKDTQEAAARAEAAKDAAKDSQRWSPVQRLALASAAILGILQLVQALLPGAK